jgi:tetratricopeptide (TPR) repeat protein
MSTKTPKPETQPAAAVAAPQAPRRWRLALMVLGVAVANLAVVWWLVGGRSGTNKADRPAAPVTLKRALALLDAGRFRQARTAARTLRSAARDPSQAISATFVLGAASALEAEEFWGRERRALFATAAKHLGEAVKGGFPSDRQQQGWLLLGKSLFHSGRAAESRAPLNQALSFGGDSVGEVHRLLASAYRTGDAADLDQALHHAEAYLAQESLSDEDRNEGLLALANVHWQLHQYAECGAALAQVPAESAVYADALLMRGRLALYAAREAKAALAADAPPATHGAVKTAFDAAIEQFRRVQDDPLAARAVRRSRYLIGICYLEMGDQVAALAQFERTRSVHLDSAEGMAAGLQEADLLRSLKRDDDAVAAYRRVLSSTTDPRRFENPWIPRDRFQARVVAAVSHYLEREQYPRALAMSEALWPLFSRSRAVELTAETYRQWAEKLLSDAKGQNEQQASTTRREGRRLMRRAGEEFRRLARLNFTERQYPDDVWRAAECCLAGQNYPDAVLHFEDYLKNEPQRRRPAALVGLGQAFLALDRRDDALSALRECMDFYPRSVASFEARLVAAKAHVAKGDGQAAEALLRENLNGEVLTPQSKEWRESLFALGELLESMGRYDEAIDRLDEAVARYPDVRRDIDARYLIGECYRKAAKAPQAKVLAATSETTRALHRKQAEQLLEKAVASYQQAQAALNRRQERSELAPLEKAVLRNSYFLVGATLFELGRHEEAIRVYSVATNRYQHDPEVLDAFVQIANCQRRLGRPIEARGAIQQAKVVLGRIKKADSDFALTTNYSRAEWTQVLDWLSQL